MRYYYYYYYIIVGMRYYATIITLKGAVSDSSVLEKATGVLRRRGQAA